MMTKKTSKTKAKSGNTKITKAIVLFGLDEDGQPRAARFMETDEELVARAAQALGLRLGIATNAKHFDVVKDLPLGRIHATGKTAVPSISQELYDKLNGLVGGDVGPISTSFAKSWEELAPGHLVVAQASLADGWWVAVLVERTGDTFKLKWRDDANLPAFERPLSAVALLSSEGR
jgi:hypothetical protein